MYGQKVREHTIIGIHNVREPLDPVTISNYVLHTKWWFCLIFLIVFRMLVLTGFFFTVISDCGSMLRELGVVLPKINSCELKLTTLFGDHWTKLDWNTTIKLPFFNY